MGHNRAVGWFGGAGMPMLSRLAAPVGAWALAYNSCGRSSQPSGQPLVLSLCPAVYARDAGLPPSLTKATVRITVGDENDHAPHLESESCSVEVPENQSRVALYTLRATDPDGGENGRLEYRVAGERHWECGTGQGLLPGLPRVWEHQLQQSYSTSFSPAPNCIALLPSLSSLPPVKSTLRSGQAALLIPQAWVRFPTFVSGSPALDQFHTSPGCSDLLIHWLPNKIFSVSCHVLSGDSPWQQHWPVSG